MNPNIYYHLYSRGYYNLAGGQGLGAGQPLNIDPVSELEENPISEPQLPPPPPPPSAPTEEAPVLPTEEVATTEPTTTTTTTSPSVNIEAFEPNFNVHIHDGLITESFPVTPYEPIYGGSIGGGGGGIALPMDEEVMAEAPKKKVNWFLLLALGAGAYFVMKK